MGESNVAIDAHPARTPLARTVAMASRYRVDRLDCRLGSSVPTIRTATTGSRRAAPRRTRDDALTLGTVLALGVTFLVTTPIAYATDAL